MKKEIYTFFQSIVALRFISYHMSNLYVIFPIKTSRTESEPFQFHWIFPPISSSCWYEYNVIAYVMYELFVVSSALFALQKLEEKLIENHDLSCQSVGDHKLKNNLLMHMHKSHLFPPSKLERYKPPTIRQKKVWSQFGRWTSEHSTLMVNNVRTCPKLLFC